MKRLTMRQLIPVLISIGVFALCLWYILLNFQWLDILRITQQANLGWLLGGGVITLLGFCYLRGLRWFLLLKNLGISVDFFSLYLCNVAVMWLTITTPFQSGEVLKVELLKRSHAVERFSGYSLFLVERVMDLLVVVSIATLSIAGSFNLGVSPISIVYLWIVLLLLLSAGIFATRNLQVAGRPGKLLQAVCDCTNNANSLIAIVLLTTGAWSMIALGWQACLRSIDIRLNSLQAIALMSVMTLVNILSFVPGAVGVSEVGITEFLSRLDVSAPSAQAGAIVVRFYGLLLIVISGVHWFIWRLVVDRRLSRATTTKE